MWFGLTILDLAACSPNVAALYEEQRTAALEVASERPAEWAPDASLSLAGPDFQAAVQSALKAALAREQPALSVNLPLGLTASLRPVFSAEEARLRPSATCPSCLDFDATLVGRAAWSLGPAGGTIPLDVSAEGVFALEVAEGHVIEAVPRAVTSIRVRVSDFAGLKFNPSRELQEYLTQTLASTLPRVRIVDLDTSALPLRDLRLRSQGGAIRIELLTNVPGARSIAAIEAPTEGVRLTLSETALIGLARRAAFQQGELAMDVYADPLAMNIEGTDFTLDLRLWRLVGRGWWRDYRVHGQLSVQGGAIQLVPKRTEELAHSVGAGIVDPLAILFEARILEAITNAVAQSLPASQAQDLGVVRMRAETTAVHGRDGTLIVDGTLVIRAPEPPGGHRPR